MPENKSFTERLQKLMESIRKSSTSAIKRNQERFSKKTINQEEQPVINTQTIEEIPTQENNKISWLYIPRGKTLGRPTSLSTKSHVTLKDYGGEIY